MKHPKINEVPKLYQGYVSSECHKLVGGVLVMINMVTFYYISTLPGFTKKNYWRDVWLASFLYMNILNLGSLVHV